MKHLKNSKRPKTSFFYIKYKHYRDKINHLIRKSKKDFHSKYFEENSNNMKKIWKKINTLIHKKDKSKDNICITSNGSFISEPKAVANKFNEFYTTVAQKLVDKMKPTDTNHK